MPELEIVAREAFNDVGVDLEQVVFIPQLTDSYWTRDYVRNYPPAGTSRFPRTDRWYCNSERQPDR